jgi:hypothetical protein
MVVGWHRLNILITTALINVSEGQGPVLASGRYWDRTSDLFRVREARYRCANRPFVWVLEVETGFEPV